MCSDYATAINCSSAKTKIEVSICSDGNLLSIDSKLNAAYQLVRKNSKYPQSVARSQINWLAYRDESCLERSDMSLCLELTMKSRVTYLLAKNEINKYDEYFSNVVGENYNFQLNGSKYDTFIFSYPIFSSLDSESKKRFNENIENRYKSDNHEVKRYVPPDDCEWSNVESTYKISYYNKKYLGVYFSEAYSSCGAAHPTYNSWNAHYDMEKSENLKFAEVFIDKELGNVYEECVNSLANEQDREIEEYKKEYNKNINSAFHNINNWEFSANEVKVLFDPYVAAPYSRGQLECSFSMKEANIFLTAYMTKLLQ